MDISSSPSRPSRRATLVALVLVPSLALLTGTVPTVASTPAAGTVGPSAPSVTWIGPPPPGGAAVTQGPDTCSDPGSFCDDFTLTVAVDPSYWSTHGGGVDVAITWTNPANDFDLYAYQGGVEVNHSTNGAPSTQEQLSLPAASGAYDLRVVYFTVGAEGYSGSATFHSATGQGGASFSSTPIAFGPATIVSHQWLGGEPQETIERPVAYSQSGAINPNRIFVDWPLSSRSGIGQIHRSLDAGDTFRLIYDPLCAERSRPTCATGGGGDTEEEVNLATGHVFFSDQEVVANEAYGFSSDHGDHFTIQDPGTGQATAVDRQWIAATDDTFSPVPGTTIEGFFSYHVPLAGEYIHAIDQSGIVLPQPAPQIPLVVQSGQSRVDNNAGSPGHGFIYLPYACLDGTCMGAAASADYATAAGWTSAVVTSDTVTSFPWAAIDAAGNAYLSWDSGGRVYFSASPIHDKANDPSQGGRPGTFWTPKVQVSLPAVGSAVFPEIIGGANGTIGLTYTGTTSFTGSPDDAPDATLWQTYAAVITDALSASPTLFSGLVSHRPVHQGNVCTSGTSCLTTGKDRSLLDMIDVAFDQQGRLGVVFEDNHSSFAQTDLATADQSPFVHWARQTSGPSVLGGSVKWGGKPGASTNDQKGDATWPNAATGTNLPSLDVTQASLARKGAKVTATISVADATVAGMTRDLAAYNTVLQTTPPAQRLQYVFRISTASEHYFVAMEFDPSSPGTCRCAFSGGRLDQNDWIANPTSGAVIGASYAPDPGVTVTGSISRGTITLTVSGAQIGLGSKTAEFSVTVFATVGPRLADLSMLNPMRTLDATKPLDTNV